MVARHEERCSENDIFTHFLVCKERTIEPWRRGWKEAPLFQDVRPGSSFKTGDVVRKMLLGPPQNHSYECHTQTHSTCSLVAIAVPERTDNAALCIILPNDTDTKNNTETEKIIMNKAPALSSPASLNVTPTSVPEMFGKFPERKNDQMRNLCEATE